MNSLDPIWQSLALAPVLAIGFLITLWIASHFNRQAND